MVYIVVWRPYLRSQAKAKVVDTIDEAKRVAKVRINESDHLVAVYRAEEIIKLWRIFEGKGWWMAWHGRGKLRVTHPLHVLESTMESEKDGQANI